MTSEVNKFCTKHGLSKRETETVLILATVTTNSAELAAIMKNSVYTVNNRLNSIFEKTGARSKSEILRLFISFLWSANR